MDHNKDRIIISSTIIEGLPSIQKNNFSNTDLDVFFADDYEDNDDDDTDDDRFISIKEVQHILQTFGRNDCSTSSIDYFDSRRYEMMYEMMNIERQFEELKNILYEDSVLLIDRKLISIQNEEATEYQNELKILYDEMKLNLEIAKQRRLIELQALENSTESELLSLEQTLENDKILLYDSVREDIEHKIHELETLKMKTVLCENILRDVLPSEQEEKQSQTISSNRKRFDYFEPVKKSIKKRRFNGTKKKYEKDNLAIFYQLSDINIIEDCALIQTSLQQSSISSDETANNNDSDTSDNYDDNHKS